MRSDLQRTSGAVGEGNVPKATQLLGPGWRADLAGVASRAHRSMIVAAPFITYEAAVWLRRQLAADVELTALASIRADAVASVGLDMTALLHLAERSDETHVIALPNLHAKVFVADDEAAIVTSGNLTRSGLDTNIEYGVLLREPQLVRAIRSDMGAFAKLGQQVGPTELTQLVSLQADLRHAREKAEAEADAESGARTRFREVMRHAKPRFVQAHIGNRSANAVFSDAILFVLRKGPLTTDAINEQVRQLLPDLCDDSEELVINGERYGKAWKHRVRNAQQHLKRRGDVTSDADTKLWARK